MVTYKTINETQVSNTGKPSGGNGCIVRVPFSWLGKKIICTLADEEKQSPDTVTVKPQ